MAGRLTVSTLNNDTGVLATQNGMSGIAKAWALFNGASATVTASFNVSSITRVGTGNYTVNFTTAFSNTNFGSLITCSDVPGTSNQVYAVRYGTNTSASSVGMLVYSLASGPASVDCGSMSVTIFST